MWDVGLCACVIDYLHSIVNLFGRSVRVPCRPHTEADTSVWSPAIPFLLKSSLLFDSLLDRLPVTLFEEESLYVCMFVRFPPHNSSSLSLLLLDVCPLFPLCCTVLF